GVLAMPVSWRLRAAVLVNTGRYFGDVDGLAPTWSLHESESGSADNARRPRSAPFPDRRQLQGGAAGVKGGRRPSRQRREAPLTPAVESGHYGAGGKAYPSFGSLGEPSD